MKSRIAKSISLLLTLSMLLSMLSTTAFAATYLDQLEAVDASVTLDGTNPGTVTVAVAGTGPMNVYALSGKWDLVDQENSGKIELSAMGSDVMTFSGMNYVDVPTGAVLWTDDSFSAPAVLEDGSRFLTATYTVAADTPAGEYTVRYCSTALCADDYETDETYTYYTAKITVTREEVETPTYLDQLEASDGSVTLDGTNPGEVTVAVVGTGPMNVYALSGKWDLVDQENSGKIELSAMGSDVMTFSAMNYVDVPTGTVLWTDDSFSAPAVLADGSRFLTATYTVAADTPAGEYTVRYCSTALCADDFETDETYTYYTAKITVTREEVEDTPTYLDELEASDGTVTLDGTNPGEVTVAVVATGAMDVYAIQGGWDTKEQESSSYLTLSALGSDVLTFSGMNYVDVPTGAVLWTDDSFSAPGVLVDGTKLTTATYTVAADAPEGEYTVRFHVASFCGTDYNAFDTDTYFTSKITVKHHIHEYEHVVTAPTCTTDGYTTYTCACGDTYTADEVPATGHTEVVDAAVKATCVATGLTEGKHCSVCSEVLVAQTEVAALGHDYQIVCTRCAETDPDAVLAVDMVGEISYNVTYAVNSRVVTVTHTAACKVGYLVDGAYVAIAANANSDGSYSFTVPDDAKNILIVVKGDVNGNGSVNATDKAFVARSMLSTTHQAYLTLTNVQIFAADVNGNGSINATDKSNLARSLLLTSHKAYLALTW